MMTRPERTDTNAGIKQAYFTKRIAGLLLTLRQEVNSMINHRVY